MSSDEAIRIATRAQGLRIKRNNLIAASLSGAALSLLAWKYFPFSVSGFFMGVLGGILYANAFEYCVHRFLLHSGRGIFAQQHRVHHETLNSPEVARYVNFSSNPWGVVALFAANGAPFFFLGWIFKSAWIAGIFVSFALYYIAFEEIHWRSHMGGRLPGWLRPAARHHLLHHAHHTDRFNVFLPVVDWISDWMFRRPAPESPRRQDHVAR